MSLSAVVGAASCVVFVFPSFVLIGDTSCTTSISPLSLILIVIVFFGDSVVVVLVFVLLLMLLIVLVVFVLVVLDDFISLLVVVLLFTTLVVCVVVLVELELLDELELLLADHALPHRKTGGVVR